MSNSLLNLAFATDPKKIHGGARLVLLALADQANDKGLCWPKAETLRLRAGLSEPHLYKALKQLRDLGVLRCHRRFNKSTLYKLAAEQLENMKLTKGINHSDGETNEGLGTETNLSYGEKTTFRKFHTQPRVGPNPVQPSIQPSPQPLETPVGVGEDREQEFIFEDGETL
jgi:DNA-binding transcriptional ArsR family regulator